MSALNQFSHSLLSGKKAIAIGAGGLAHAALPYLITSGLTDWIIYDGDLVTQEPRNRQWLFESSDLGRKKASALANRLLQKFEGLTLLAVDDFFQNEQIEAHIVFDFTDRLVTKQQLAHHFFECHIPLVYAAAFANSGCVSFIHPKGVRPEQVFPEKDVTLANADCERDGVWPTTIASVGLRAAEVGIDFLSKGKTVLDHAIDYYNAEDQLWNRFHFQSTPVEEKNESQPAFDPNHLRWINLGHEPVMHSKVINVLATETEHYLKEHLSVQFGVFCETGAKASLLAKRFPNQLIAWNGASDDLIQLLHD